MYFGKLYNSFIERNRLNIYGSRLIKLPTPKYVVLYRPAYIRHRANLVYPKNLMSTDFEEQFASASHEASCNEVLSMEIIL